METINALGMPCPIPVIEAKKALAKLNANSVLVMVDNIVAVQNLEKMANGFGYIFSYENTENNVFEVSISLNGKAAPVNKSANKAKEFTDTKEKAKDLVVVIGRNTMGSGSEDLGKILIKGFIYSLTELEISPRFVIFLNSGAYLTSKNSNVIQDLKTLEEKGAQILTCGTCANYYGIQEDLAVGTIVNMYDITEKMANGNVINI